MEAVQGRGAAEDAVAGLEELSPDFASYTIEAVFGDVYSRPGLRLDQRELLNIAVLTALGGCEPQLAVHVRAALNVGLSAQEVLEAIFHVSVYAGHPRAINALRVVREVLDEQGIAIPR